MESFVAVVHILFAVVLVVLILLQDSKDSTLGGAFGGGGSQSLFGATGAATLAQKATRWCAVFFAVTSILLSLYSTRAHKSVVDGISPSAPVASPAAQGTVAPAAGDRANEPRAGTPPPAGDASAESLGGAPKTDPAPTEGSAKPATPPPAHP